MNKLIVLFYCLMAVLAITCARPTSYFGVRPVFRNIAVYANPFVWLGKPTLPQRVPKNKSGKNKRRYRYKWFIEVDETNHWWVTVYENQARIPGPGRKVMMKLY